MSDKKVALTRRRVLGGLGAIGAAGAAGGAGTFAYFSDTEESSGNTVSAGTLDLTPDGQSVETFSVSGVKPTDSGTETISLSNAGTLPGYLNVSVDVTGDSENTVEEPEPDSDDATSGELAEAIDVEIGFDTDSDDSIEESIATADGADDICDENRVARAIEWLEQRRTQDEPWVLSVNPLIPHFPLEVEQSYYDLYPTSEMDLPVDYPSEDDHPSLQQLRDHFDGSGLDEDTLRRTRSAYYGLVTALDNYVGEILDTLERTGQMEDTLVIYTSDHGEILGDHGLWWKCCMYEQSVGVPLVMSGPDIEKGQTIDQPVSLLDVLPTMTDALAISADPAWRGVSLLPVARGEQSPDSERAVFSEYHAHGVSRGFYMIRRGRYKYVYYLNGPNQLFDLESDPYEMQNLVNDPDHSVVRQSLEGELLDVVDPVTTDKRARSHQRRRREQVAPDGPSNFNPNR